MTIKFWLMALNGCLYLKIEIHHAIFYSLCTYSDKEGKIITRYFLASIFFISSFTTKIYRFLSCLTFPILSTTFFFYFTKYGSYICCVYILVAHVNIFEEGVLINIKES